MKTTPLYASANMQKQDKGISRLVNSEISPIFGAPESVRRLANSLQNNQSFQVQTKDGAKWISWGATQDKDGRRCYYRNGVLYRRATAGSTFYPPEVTTELGYAVITKPVRVEKSGIIEFPNLHYPFRI